MQECKYATWVMHNHSYLRKKFREVWSHHTQLSNVTMRLNAMQWLHLVDSGGKLKSLCLLICSKHNYCYDFIRCLFRLLTQSRKLDNCIIFFIPYKQYQPSSGGAFLIFYEDKLKLFNIIVSCA